MGLIAVMEDLRTVKDSTILEVHLEFKPGYHGRIKKVFYSCGQLSSAQST